MGDLRAARFTTKAIECTFLSEIHPALSEFGVLVLSK
jgi:hypothetical protein